MEIDLENLASALSRAGLTDADAPRRPGGEDVLRGFIRSAAIAGGTYALLAQKLRGGPGEGALRALSEEELSTELSLQRAYFALTGDTLALPPLHPSAPGVLSSLRSSAAAERENARRYDLAAGEFEPLRELFAGLAEKERRHAGILESLALRVFGGG